MDPISKTVLEISTNVAKPLALGGLVVGVLFLVVRKILDMNIFANVGGQATVVIIKKIINTILILAIISIVLGFFGYAFELIIHKVYPGLDPKYVEIGIQQEKSFQNVCKALSQGRNVTIVFDSSCSDEVKQAMIDAGKHTGKNVKEFIEKIGQRVKGEAIAYQVEQKGDRRYEIVCP